MSQLPRLGAALVLSLTAATAHAVGLTRAWVSGIGDDANPCARTAPCKTFAGAQAKTAPGGEITAIDAGSYGVVTITQALTINGEGSVATISAPGLNAITVNAGPNDRVVLRNLSINGVNTGLSGIRYLSGKELVVTNVSIRGFTQSGIEMAVAGGGNLHVLDTVISNSTGAASIANSVGMDLESGNGLGLVTLDNVRLQGLNNGLVVGANTRVTATDSVFSSNVSNGILASASTAVVNVADSQIAFNALVGVNASVAGATIRLAANHIYNNTQGVTIAAGATVSSDGNNRVAGNGSSTSPNGTITVE